MDKRQQRIVSTLESVLKDAKNGLIFNMVMISNSKENDELYTDVSSEETVKMIGNLTMIANDLSRLKMEESRMMQGEHGIAGQDEAKDNG